MASRTNLFWIFFLHQLHSCKRFEEYATRCQIENDREIKRNPQPSLEMQPFLGKVHFKCCFPCYSFHHWICFVFLSSYSMLTSNVWMSPWVILSRRYWRTTYLYHQRKEQVVAGLFGETGSMWAQRGCQFSTWRLTWVTQPCERTLDSSVFHTSSQSLLREPSRWSQGSASQPRITGAA